MSETVKKSALLVLRRFSLMLLLRVCAIYNVYFVLALHNWSTKTVFFNILFAMLFASLAVPELY